MTNLLLRCAIEMRNAIDAHEQAMMGLGDFVELPELFADHQGDLVVTPKLQLREVRRVCETLSELTRIINSDDYTPTQMSMFTAVERRPRGPGNAGLIRWIIKQLPDDKAEGLLVLDQARALVQRFKR